MFTKNCTVCGKEFPKSYTCSMKEWNEQRRYCSRDCYWKSLKNKPSNKKGKPNTENQNREHSEAMKGRIPWNKGKELFEFRGENHPRWKGGRKITRLCSQNKRDRDLGFNLINEQLKDDEVAHHLTKEFVAFVPEFINKSVYHNIHNGKNMDEVNFYTLNYLFLVYNKE